MSLEDYAILWMALSQWMWRSKFIPHLDMVFFIQVPASSEIDHAQAELCHLTMTWTHLSYLYDLKETRQICSSNQGLQIFFFPANEAVIVVLDRKRRAAHFAVGMRNVTKHLWVVGLQAGSWTRDLPVRTGNATGSTLTITLLEKIKISSSVNKFITAYM